MRGEDWNYTDFAANASGSPPHARGRLAGVQLDVADPGITPACAGKTTSRPSAAGHRKDHPRMRGEDSIGKIARSNASGSPPHARGRPHRGVRRVVLHRITPACAGKTQIASPIWWYSSDHPRMRGEDLVAVTGGGGVFGSPPHARGRPIFCRLGASPVGITPACAGKTKLSSDISAFKPDHPRMRGEDGTLTAPAAAIAGSPPHARGRPRLRLPTVGGATDHPRMRGEDACLKYVVNKVRGSPPHARGRRDVLTASGTPRRITPACAGKTPGFHTVARC